MKKTSRTGVRNAIAKAETRKSGPPKVSKYAAKRGVTCPHKWEPEGAVEWCRVCGTTRPSA